jgi:NADPH2:quinone reductase
MNTSAFQLVKYNSPEKAFRLEQIALRGLLVDEVLIEVDAFGLNYADVMARNGLYKDAPPLPCVLGYEVVGRVVDAGSLEAKKWIGQRVVAFTRFGGYARHAITKCDVLMPINEDIEVGCALALATQYLTAYYMVYVASNIFKGDHVLVHAAAGGVGTALIQMLKEREAVVYAKCGAEEKRDYVLNQGADFFINYNAGDYTNTMKLLLQGRKIDVSMNPIGGQTFKRDLELLKPGGGKIFLFGGSDLTKARWGLLSQLNFVRKMGFITPILLMMKSQSIIGVNMLRIGDNNPAVMRICMDGVLNLYSKKVLNPQIGAEFSSNHLAEAHRYIESGNSKGKICVVWR